MEITKYLFLLRHRRRLRLQYLLPEAPVAVQEEEEDEEE
jgi:hypothetical protein